MYAKLVKVSTLSVGDVLTAGVIVSLERGECTIDPERGDCVMFRVKSGEVSWEAHRRPDAWETLLTA